jgi:hypothetical protein
LIKICTTKIQLTHERIVSRCSYDEDDDAYYFDGSDRRSVNDHRLLRRQHVVDRYNLHLRYLIHLVFGRRRHQETGESSAADQFAADLCAVDLAEREPELRGSSAI